MAGWRTRCTVAVAAVLVAALAGGSVSNARTGGSCSPGVHALDLGSGSTALMRVTPGAAGPRRALLLVLHDAGRPETEGLSVFRGGWSSPGLVLVAPSARGTTWSFERGRGDDLATVGHALTQAVTRCVVDSRRIGIGGFGAGATSALSLGMTNGRLFRAIIALSPESLETQRRVGRPRVFVAHGTDDPVIPLARIEGVVVPALRRDGYSVTFHPFAGGHTVPTSVSRAAVQWFLG